MQKTCDNNPQFLSIKMPKTNKERQRIFYEKNKNNALFKERRRVKEKTKRLAIKNDNILKKKVREQCRDRVRRWRCSKIATKGEVLKNAPYKSRSSLGKAVSRVMKALPPSPTKRSAVVNQLLKKIVLPSSGHRDSRLQIDDSIKQIIMDYYQREEHTWTSPNKKDVTKLGVHKQYLIMTILELYNAFKLDFPDIKVGKSKFAQFRPNHVKSKQSIPHNQCLCIYHQNVNLILEKLKPHAAKLSTNSEVFIDTMCCESFSADCAYYQTCLNCDLSCNFKFFENINLDTLVTWEQWKVDEKVETKKSEGTIKNLIDVLFGLLPLFKKHVYVNRMQKKHFRSLRNDLQIDETTAVIQIDFAENFSIRRQDEIQSAYFQNEQISIFTVVTWLKGCICSFAFVSDELHHDKYSVYTYLNHLFSVLTLKYPLLHNFHIFSDGASSHFKQRYTITSIFLHMRRYKINILWHFFATAHGKGAVDGIGAVVKSEAWNLIKSKECKILNARDLVDALTCKVTLFHVEKASVEQCKSFLDEFWTDMATIQNIQHYHSFTYEENVVICKHFSNEVCGRVYNLPDSVLPTLMELDKISNMHEGDLIMVHYNGADYPAKINTLNINSVVANFMQSVGRNMWIWPYRNDVRVCQVNSVTLLSSTMELTAIGSTKRISHYQLNTL